MKETSTKKTKALSEVAIEKYFVKQCRANEMWAKKNNPQYDAGVPDRQVLWKGFTGFAEVKAPGEKPDPLQVAYINRLKKEGFYVGNFEGKVGYFDSKEGADAWILGFEDHIIELIRQFRSA